MWDDDAVSGWVGRVSLPQFAAQTAVVGGPCGPTLSLLCLVDRVLEYRLKDDGSALSSALRFVRTLLVGRA